MPPIAGLVRPIRRPNGEEGSGKVFCLATGPSKESVIHMRERAGHPAGEVYDLPIAV